MYGKCVWYQLNDSNNLNKIIESYSTKFNAIPFKAHLTVVYNLRNVFNTQTYELKNNEFFNIVGLPYANYEDGVYSIQQDYKLNTNPTHLYHVSFAYKFDGPFTNVEVNYIRNQHIPKIIEKKDIIIHLWDCNNNSPNTWKLIQ